jgi:hypothetical protein
MAARAHWFGDEPAAEPADEDEIEAEPGVSAEHARNGHAAD